MRSWWRDFAWLLRRESWPVRVALVGMYAVVAGIALGTFAAAGVAVVGWVS